MKDKSRKWTEQEEKLVLDYLNTYKFVSELPLVAMSEKLKRTSDSIKRKATRLKEANKPRYIWDKDESKEAFLLYLQGLPAASILEKLQNMYEAPYPTLDQIDNEVKSLREDWSKHIGAYAEGRGLPVAKQFKLDTISFYIENRLTDKDFIRKVLHGKIKNG